MLENFGGLNLDNSFMEQLDSSFYSIHEPDFTDAARIIYLNHSLLEQMHLDKDFFVSKAGEDLLLGRMKIPGKKFFAQSYAGHQFGNFVKLGDGRALMLGEHLDNISGRRVDLQWKGSGVTSYSRGGDGKASLAPMLRELLISEYLHALEIPTTRVLGVISTGDKVFRNQYQNGAAILRVAQSHLRVGSFEFAAAFTSMESKRSFLRYTMKRHSSDASKNFGLSPTIEEVRYFFEEVVQRQIRLIAQWMTCGFIHGVMNTDNMSISGESIDFGPCAFLNQFYPKEVFSSIDRHGRYAYVNQPSIAIWNLTRFAESILEFLGDSESEAIEYAQAVLKKSSSDITIATNEAWLKKIGLDVSILHNDPIKEQAAQLKMGLLKIMEENALDFTNTFRVLSEPGDLSYQDIFLNKEFHGWYEEWKKFQIHKLGRNILDVEKSLRDINPRYIPRNMFLQKILDRAEQDFDIAECLTLLKILQHPFVSHNDDNPLAAELEKLSDTEKDFVSFCGT